MQNAIVMLALAFTLTYTTKIFNSLLRRSAVYNFTTMKQKKPVEETKNRIARLMD